MIFTETRIGGAFLVDVEEMKDSRGSFARTWCKREFASKGLNADLAQCSMSVNTRRGTLRGMHYQLPPREEVKLVRCTQGAIYDVIVDLRVDSPTFTQWFGVELTAANRRMLYVPEGLAHGFQTLLDDTEVFYQISEFYEPGFGAGVRWDDPAFGIDWPPADRTISPRDSGYPSFIHSLIQPGVKPASVKQKQ